jgi:hypothetical protein
MIEIKTGKHDSIPDSANMIELQNEYMIEFLTDLRAAANFGWTILPALDHLWIGFGSQTNLVDFTRTQKCIVYFG